MVSSVSSSFVCVLCVILLPPVWAFHCRSYWDADGHHHDLETCFPDYCCGSCTQRYCCNKIKNRLTQELCPDSLWTKSNTAVLLAGILGSVILIFLCVGLCICFVAPCCLFYKKCRKRHNRRDQVSTPLQPFSHTAPQPTHPGYQSVPAQPGFGGLPNPTGAAGSYVGATNPAPPPAFSAGQPLLPYPGPAYAPPPHSSELVQPPYNPTYVPTS